ncbi:MAG: phage virion morphogenesis protein [Bacteroidales bacterium]
MNLLTNILRDLRIELADKFDKNFSQGGFFGQKWQRKKDGTSSRLIKSGVLRRSIRSRTKNNGIVFTSSTPYAAVHNEGGRAGRGRGFQMPKRQFIGAYKGIEKTIERIAKKELEKTLKSSIKR